MERQARKKRKLGKDTLRKHFNIDDYRMARDGVWSFGSQGRSRDVGPRLERDPLPIQE